MIEQQNKPLPKVLLKLIENSQNYPDKVAFTFIEAQGEVELTFKELEHQARVMAKQLLDNGKKGDRVALLLPNGAAYIISMYACMFAGLVSVPLYPARAKDKHSRIDAVVDNCNSTIIVTLSDNLENTKAYFDSSSYDFHSNIVTFEALLEGDAIEIDTQIDADDISYLQYTSGSTGIPKGAIITYGNIAANLDALIAASDSSEKDVFVNWLPLFHDLGLVNTLFLPAYIGAQSVIMSPSDFIRNPFSWLSAIDKYKGTICGGPNFSFDHCCKHVTDEQVSQLDLSSWQVAFNAGEPIRAKTFEKFHDKFKLAGFSKEAYYPSYGMAEITVFLSAPLRANCAITTHFCTESLGAGIAKALDTGATAVNSTTLLGCGQTYTDHSAIIVDPTTLEILPDNQIGEIWASGSSVALGYWGREEETAKTFGAQPKGSDAKYLRTGDLGFIYNGEIYVAGRIKDTIIINGTNYYPQDIEFVAEQALEGLPLGNAAAFSIEDEATEKLVLVQELRPSKDIKEELDSVIHKISEAISTRIGLDIYSIKLVRKGKLLKTSSGKVKRQATKESFLNGDLGEYHGVIFKDAPSELADNLELTRQIQANAVDRNTLFEYLQAEISSVTKQPIDNVSYDSSLLSLVMNSLRASQLQARLERTFSVSLPLAELLAVAKVKDLIDTILLKLNNVKTEQSIEPQQIIEGKLYPASANQRSLWSLHQRTPLQTAYNIHYAFKFESSSLEIDRVKCAWDKVIAKHAALRTQFQFADGILNQKISSDLGEYFTHKHCNNSVAIEDALQQAASYHFDLENGPLIRIELISSSEDNYLAITLHHIVTDMHSMMILIEDFKRFYTANTVEEYEQTNAFSYVDFTLWQSKVERSEPYQTQHEFWQDRLSNVNPNLELVTDFVRPKSYCYDGEVASLMLNSDEKEAVKQFAVSNNITMNQLLLSIYFLFLYRYTGQDDIVVGTPSMGRHLSCFNSTIGYFVNPLPIRSSLSRDLTFQQLLTDIKQNLLSAMANSQVPFEHIVNSSLSTRLENFAPLFQTMFVYQTTDAKDYEVLDILLNNSGALALSENERLIPVQRDKSTAQFDLMLEATEFDQSIKLEINYNTSLFERATAENMLNSIKELLFAVIQNQHETLDKVAILSESQEHKVAAMLAPRRRFNNASNTIQSLFEAQVERGAEQIAVESTNGDKLTYLELNKRANQLARHLQTQGIRAGDKIALLIDRNINTVVAILAVLKAGAAYVPLNTTNPSSRLEGILLDAQVDFMICESNTEHTIFDGKKFIIDADAESQKLAEYSGQNLQVDIENNALAYVIYTSGSTGKPKGVMVTHNNVMRLIDSACELYSFSDQDVWTLFHSYSFDVSVWEMWGALFTGAKLIVMPLEIARDSFAMRNLVQHYGVTVLSQTPSAFYPFMAVEGLESYHHELRYVVFGGEKLELQKLQPWFEANSNSQTKLVNMYGITETCVHSTFKEIGASALKSTGNLIGQPLGDIGIYICNDSMQIQPFGVIGEMYLTGDCVAKGYLNNETLTSERFFNHQFPGQQSLPVYKSGDLAYLRHDGELCYVSRADDQVKVRGFRIELGEIEGCIQALDGVKEAAVLCVTHDESKKLVGYVVADQGVDSKGVFTHLKRHLPDYMVPASIMMLDNLPLTANGKLNKRALPEPIYHHGNDVQSDTVPVTPLELELLDIWARLLSVPKENISKNDSFFSLGGDSILAIQLSSQAKLAGLSLTPNDIFKHPTIEMQAVVGDKESEVLIECETEPRSAPLTAIQKWFFSLDLVDHSRWTQSLRLEVKEGISKEVYQAAFKQLIQAHRIFKTGFSGDAQHYLDENALASLEYNTVGSAQEARLLEAKLQGSLNIETGNTVAASYICSQDTPDYIFITIHHLIVDAVSWRILIEDFSHAILDRVNNVVSERKNTTSYFQWAAELHAYSDVDSVAKEIPYWQGIIDKHYTALPFRSEMQATYEEQKKVTVELGQSETHTLLKKAKDTFNTEMQDILLSALGIALHSWSGGSDFMIDLEGHGRASLNERIDLSRTIGWFTSIYPFSLRISDPSALGQTVIETKERLRNVPEAGFNYSVINYLANDIQQNHRAPILFNYLGQLDYSLQQSDAFNKIQLVEEGDRNPDDKRAYPIEVLSKVQDGQLCIELLYDELTLSETTARQLVNDIHTQLQQFSRVCLDQDTCFYTPSDFPLIELPEHKFNSLIHDLKLSTNKKISNILPTTETQESILFHCLSSLNKSLYFEQVKFNFTKKLNAQYWAEAWEQVIERHQILRSGFVYKNCANPLLVVYEEQPFSMTEYDFSHLDASTKVTYLANELNAQRQKGFNLEDAPLSQYHLYKMSDSSFVFVWNFHHSILDGWSMANIIKEVLTIYEQRLGREIQELPVAAKLEDYVEFKLANTSKEKETEYFWSNYLKGISTATTLLADRYNDPKLDETLEEKENFSKDFSPSQSEKIFRFLTKEKLTLNHFMHTLYTLLIASHSGSKDIMYGETYSGRPAEVKGIEQLAGLFVKSLPVRQRLEAGETINSLLQKQKSEQSSKNGHLDIEQDRLYKLTNFSSSQLFEILLNVNNYPIDNKTLEQSTLIDLQDIEHHGESPTALTLIVIPRDNIQLYFCYDVRRFSRVAITNLLDDIHYLAEFVCDQPDTSVTEVLQNLDERKRNLRSATSRKRVIRTGTSRREPSNI